MRERYPSCWPTRRRMIADPLVRNMGTVGGSLAHGDPAEDLPAAFMALGCEVVARGPEANGPLPSTSCRPVPSRPYSSRRRSSTEARVLRAPMGSAYTKVKRRTGDYASAAIGVALNISDGEIGTPHRDVRRRKPDAARPRRGRDPRRDNVRTRSYTGGPGSRRRRGVRSHRGRPRPGRVQARPGEGRSSRGRWRRPSSGREEERRCA